jgi:hypothetical protein
MLFVSVVVDSRKSHLHDTTSSNGKVEIRGLLRKLAWQASVFDKIELTTYDGYKLGVKLCSLLWGETLVLTRADYPSLPKLVLYLVECQIALGGEVAVEAACRAQKNLGRAQFWRPIDMNTTDSAARRRAALLHFFDLPTQNGDNQGESWCKLKTLWGGVEPELFDLL